MSNMYELAALMIAYGQADDIMDLYVNDRFVRSGSMDELVPYVEANFGPGDRLSFRERFGDLGVGHCHSCGEEGLLIRHTLMQPVQPPNRSERREFERARRREEKKAARRGS